MAEETRSGGGNKLRRALRILKDQTAAGRASAGGALQVAVVRATSHEECLPEEKYVEEILAAGTNSRSTVSFCTKGLLTRLRKTQDWTVALKALILIHRAILDGGFLFQDHLTASFSFSQSPDKEEEEAEGRDSLSKLLTLRDENLSPRSREISTWVRRYARYLDRRLICSIVVKSHFESKWSSAHTSERVCFMPTEEVLADLLQLQSLLEQGCDCDVAHAAAGGVDGPNHLATNPLVQGALILVVADSYKLQQEIGLRLREMLDRLDILQTSETLELIQICKRSGYQTQSLLRFLEHCRELVNLLSDLPLPQTGFISEFEMKKLKDSLTGLKKTSSSSSSSTLTFNTKPKLTISSSDGTLFVNSISGPQQTKPDFQRTGSGYYKNLEPAHGSSQSMKQFPQQRLAETTSEEAPANQPAADQQSRYINCHTELQNLQKDIQDFVELELSTDRLQSSSAASSSSLEFNLIDFSSDPAEMTSLSSRKSKVDAEELSKDLISWVPLQQAASVSSSPSSPQAATRLAEWEQLLVDSLKSMGTGSSNNNIDYSATSTHQLNTIPSAAAATSASMMNLQHSFYPSYIVPGAAAIAVKSRSFSSSNKDHMHHTEFLKQAPGSMQAAANATAGSSGGVLEPILSTPNIRANFKGYYYSGSSEKHPIVITQHLQHQHHQSLQHLNHQQLQYLNHHQHLQHQQRQLLRTSSCIIPE